MKIAALYDIHGNLPALDAVLAEARALVVDEIVIGGDVVPGPMPRECLERLRGLDLPVRYIRGNGEREVLLRMHGEPSAVPPQFDPPLRWTAEQLDRPQEEFMAEWPSILRVGDVLFCHATPRSDTDIFTRATPDDQLLPILEMSEADVIVCGHTHMQFDRVVGRKRVVNAGSVGMPFDRTGAHWLLVDGGIELRTTVYDLDAAAEAIRMTSFPGAAEFAANYILSVPGEARMLDAYSRVKL